ncbi:TobH protein [Tsukamurella sp. NPDC003166]|uniref:TobH protein n=1 Tax=Tsukamurella sp. NPDC003166 TaxID=3154444 RepID=UPI0033B5A3CF
MTEILGAGSGPSGPQVTDLDDPAGLIAADVGGHLRAAALAGAQARAVAAAVEEGALEQLDGIVPRAVVVVCGAGPAAAAAGFVEALTAGRFDVPLVRSTELPPWVGALDVVVVCGFDAGDLVLARAIAVAARRGATVVVAVPLEGPVAEAAAGRTVDLSPRLRVPERFGFIGVAAALLAVLGRIAGTDRPAAPGEGFLFALAEALDDEALRGAPDRDVESNPAKRLAARMAGRRIALTADTAAGLAVAEHAASQALTLGGQVVAAVGLADVELAVPELAAAPSGGALSGSDALFHDPFLDGPAAQTPLRVLVLTTEERAPLVQARLRALPDVEPLPVDEGARRAPDAAGPRADAQELLALAVRFDLASVYRRLTGEA